MTGELKYGDIALGVECALPVGVASIRRTSRVSRLITWMRMAFARRT